MQRRGFLCLFVAAPLYSRSAEDAWDALSGLASALGQGSAEAFAGGLDPGMPRYQALRDEVSALLRTFDVQSSLDLIENSGDDQTRTVEVHWLLVLTTRADVARSTRREHKVRCQFVKRGRKWLLAEMQPADFLKP